MAPCCTGVEWQPVRQGIAEIAGFADEHLRAFSTRGGEILAAAGPDASARSLQVTTLATRRAKQEGLGRGELLERWCTRAQEIGLTPETIALALEREGAPRIVAEPRTVPTSQLDRAVTAGALHFDRRGAIQAIADVLPSGTPGAEVERLADAYLASEAVIQIAATPRSNRHTTRRLWELERAALAAAERSRGQGPAPAGELVAAAVIASRPT